MNLNQGSLGIPDTILYCATALGLPVERVAKLPEFRSDDSKANDHRSDILSRLLNAVRKPPKRSVEVIRLGLGELVQHSDGITTESCCLGPLVPSAIEHWLDIDLLQSEMLLHSILAPIARERGGGIWRLPRLHSSSLWQPLLVSRKSKDASYVVRAHVNATEFASSWFDEAVTLDQIFPSQVRQLRPWTLEGFSARDHERALANLTWLQGEVPDWLSRDQFAWNRAIEISTGVRWLAVQLSTLASVPHKRSIDERKVGFSYEYPEDVVGRLTQSEWAWLRVAGETSISREVKFVPERLKLEAHSVSLDTFARSGSGQPTTSARVSVVPVSDGHRILMVEGGCGGRKILTAMGREPRVDRQQQPFEVNLRDLVTSFAEAFVLASTERVAGNLAQTFLSGNLQKSDLRVIAEQLAGVFLAENIAIWRRLTPNGPVSLFLEHDRPDLYIPARVGALKSRPVDGERLGNAVTGVSLAEHPLGRDWVSPRAREYFSNWSVSLFPIRSGDHLYGLVEILDVEPGREPSWSHLMKNIFDVLELFLPHSGSLEYRDLETRRSVRHQMRPALTALQDNASAIVRLSKQKRSPATQKELHVRSGMIESIIEDLRELLNGLTEKNTQGRKTLSDPVLEFAKRAIEEGAGQTSVVSEQVEAAFSSVASQLRRRNVRLDISEVDPNICVSIPAAALQIILSNLATNAAKYAASGTQVKVRTRATLLGTLVLEVTNVGGQMSGQERDIIFQRNFRSYAASNSAAPGEGVGLYHVRGVAKMLGGNAEYLTDDETSRGAMTHTLQIQIPRSLVSSGIGKGT